MGCFVVFSVGAFCNFAEAGLSIDKSIGKVARLFDPKLVEVEGRVQFLERKVKDLAMYNEHVLSRGIGFRGVKLAVSEVDPSMTLDLGESFPIDGIFLVPVLGGGEIQGSIFPKRFTIELSNFEDFSDSQVVYCSKDKYFLETEGKPVGFMGEGASGRFVRITINQGHLRKDDEVFGLSEVVVVSDGYPVSFGCDITAEGALHVEGLWYLEAIVDGKMPLGVWEGGQWAKKRQKGGLLSVMSEDEQVSWCIDLGRVYEISLVNLFPFEMHGVLDLGILPEMMDIQVRNSPNEDFRTIAHWSNPVQGGSQDTPQVFNFNNIEAREIRIVGLQGREVAGEFLYGISEIEVWSEKENIAKGLPVVRDVSGIKSILKCKTNGFASNREIISLGSWLNQLNERWKVENELEVLQPVYLKMASESELNTTWGSAIVLGLTFLIPVFIVERRRLISRNQIDQLRSRIASDLHDDIGSNLGSISMIARTARKDLIRLAGPTVVEDDLNELESIAKESSLAMRDIVWLLEKKEDSIGDLVHRMRETASRMLREIEYSIECESTKVDAKLSLDAKRHFFLFYKETIYNIVKHSKASKISIRLWDKRDKLVLEVTDNGCGLETVGKYGKQVPIRLRKLDERARVLEASLVVKAENGKGTTIRLTVKRSILMASQLSK